MQPREPRYHSQGIVQLLHQAADNQQALDEYHLVNISRGGLCFESQDSFELNEQVTLNVLIQQQKIHSAKARICYRHKKAEQDTCYGLSFLDRFIDSDVIKSNRHT